MEKTKLAIEFGVQPIDQALIKRFEDLTGEQAHRFLRRGIFCGHRNLEEILDCYERGEPFYLYTGRGPSSESLHLGHLIALEFTQYLQEVFQVPLVVQMTDDEKFLRNTDKTMEEIQSYTDGNLRDLIALGFDPRLTYIFRDTEVIGMLYPNILRMQRNITLSQVKATFGCDDSERLGNVAFPINQAVPAVSSTFPDLFAGRTLRCLIPCALDQDVYFRMTRDICAKLKEPKPCLILSSFLPDLRGPKVNEELAEEAEATGKNLAELSKMSSTSKTEPANPTVIFLNYPRNKVKKIVNRHGFSGGQDTAELQRKLGGNPEVDMSFKYLEFFLESDEELERIRLAYLHGEMLTGELKKVLIDLLGDQLEAFQKRRAEITDDEVKRFTAVRSLL